MWSSLSDYLLDLPKDPSTQKVCLTRDCFCGIEGRCHSTPYPKFLGIQKIASKPGYYDYGLYWNNGVKDAGVLIMAKVETPQFANYVVVNTLHNDRNSFAGTPFNYASSKYLDIKDLHLCTVIEKTAPGNVDRFEVHADGTVTCTYSNAYQLFYIEKVQ